MCLTKRVGSHYKRAKIPQIFILHIINRFFCELRFRFKFIINIFFFISSLLFNKLFKKYNYLCSSKTGERSWFLWFNTEDSFNGGIITTSRRLYQLLVPPHPRHLYWVRGRGPPGRGSGLMYPFLLKDGFQTADRPEPGVDTISSTPQPLPHPQAIGGWGGPP